ncbi:HD-GYP domain-containing protein [Vibrio orientalis]|uniref:HDIG domain protein n=2 Tax=Vibrio orientalis CIP 102891 = ATCC 33934 TaxID=675816 RepID=A0ABM9Z3Y9_VIBOR|nr:HD-GYP domain-containing protein [Vibrio orientalis]EEX94420.1 HDIG domain protein [Vibrio orientalis CIP 102891 = ATCC 33934]
MEFPKEDVRVDMHRVLFEIAYALDAVGYDEIYHGHRVAYIAYSCAIRMGWSEEKAHKAFALGLIHDCGVSESSELDVLLTSFIPKETQRHCIKGYELLKACEPLSQFAIPILYHHTDWRQLAEIPNISDEDKQLSALIFLADRVDYLQSSRPYDVYGNVTSESKEFITGELAANAGIMFEPSIVESMNELLTCDDFWFSMELRHIENLSSQFVHAFGHRSNTGLEESICVAELFAQIVDAKSSFTYQHSNHVARLAEFLAGKLGYSTQTCRMLYLAGLIHDIGKLKTPSSILHKPDQLTDDEYCCIKRHATDSRHALENMFKDSLVIDWAANHHERLDGSGYPLGLTAEQLDGPSRLVAVTDVFQALTQSRPYRAGLSLDKTLTILEELVENGKLDRQVFDCISANRDICYRISTGREYLAEPA